MLIKCDRISTKVGQVDPAVGTQYHITFGFKYEPIYQMETQQGHSKSVKHCMVKFDRVNIIKNVLTFQPLSTY